MKRPLAASHASLPDVHRDAAELAWLALMRRGDIAAFEQLFRSFAAELTDFASTYVGTDEDAEETVHVVFCWVWEHRFTLPHPRSVRSYLFAAVRNHAMNVVRDRRSEAAFRNRTERAARESNVAATSPSPDHELAARDIEHALGEALRQMPPRCREVYTLVRDHGLTYGDVADALGIAPKTVEIHMSRTLRILRHRLAPWLHE
jgi:RNA polymerase sigma-70 factor, ECF subfamily